MKTIGIKLADGSFYPVLKDNEPCEAKLELTTAHNNQTRIMVDLYRSESESMDDAEYVDTLQIDHINEHPRGDASIAFVVAIDENKELSAHIQDEETGLESETTIELINRTLEQRMADEPGDYDISETAISEEELGAIDLEKHDEPALKEPEPASEPEESHEESAEESIEEPVIEDNDIAAGAAAGGGLLAAAMLLNKESEEPSVEEVPVETPEDTSIETEPETSIESESETESFNADELVMDDIVLDDEPVFDDKPLFEEEPAETEESATEDSFASEKISDDPFATDDPFTTEDSFGTDDPFATDDSISSDPVPSDYDLPDFDDSPAPSFNSDFFSKDNDMQESESLFDLPDFDEEPAPAIQDNDMDWDFDEELTRAENSGSSDSSSGLSFTGLYDKETELGESSYSDDFDDDDKKKTKTSVVICIICAIICIIAVLLILFVIPSKLNVLKKGQNSSTKTEVVENEVKEPEIETKTEPVIQEKIEEKFPEPKEPQVPEAKEDEVVIIEEAEEVKPEPPAPPVKEEPKPDIRYKIKWGDTLWDIADTYYKNPWRYKKIARYNGIRNPDYIISGRTILIPQE